MARTIVFVTGTGTDVGKTHLTCEVLRALRARGVDAAGVKPIETGVGPAGPVDALALDEASSQSYADHRGFYRAVPALGPMAIDETPLPPLHDLAATIDAIADDHDVLFVEGAGGPLVPLAPAAPGSPDRCVAIIDLAALLGARVILVVRDELGCLSHTLTAVESIEARGLTVARILLNRFGEPDASQASNEHDLRRLGLPLGTPAAPWWFEEE